MLRHPLAALGLLAALMSFVTGSAYAQDDIRTEPVHFKAGTNGATVNGEIKGYETVDYVLEASKGQHMTVSLSTDNGGNYFNVLAPGENEVAMFVGSTSGNKFSGALPKNGAYKIRVYLMRNAARRNEVAKYQLKMAITGAAAQAAGGKDEQACLEAVAAETSNTVVTLSVDPSEANTIVMVGVGPNKAPWKCLSKDGNVAEVMSMTDEGRL